MDTAVMEQSIALVKEGMVHLERRYEERERGVKEYTPVDFQPFYGILSDDVVFHVPTSTTPPDGDYSRQPWNVVGKVHKSKQALIDAFEADQSDITNWEIGRPLEYFSSADGSRVVVLLQERFEKPGGRVPWTESAMVFDIQDRKVVRYTHIADMSAYIVLTSQ